MLPDNWRIDPGSLVSECGFLPGPADGVRKAYVVQIVADGARVLEGGTETAPHFHRCDAPDRQFYILKAGRQTTS